MIEYRLLLPKTKRLFDENELVFTINHIRSRRPSILYFLLHCYDKDGNALMMSNGEVISSGDPRRFVKDTEIQLNTSTTVIEEDSYLIEPTNPSSFVAIIGDYYTNAVLIHNDGYLIKENNTTVKDVSHTYVSDARIYDKTLYLDDLTVDLSNYNIDFNTIALHTHTKLYRMKSDDSIVAYTSPRGVIGTTFNTDGADYTQTFTVQDELIKNTYFTQIEIRTLGIDSENPLYFTELMFQEGREFDGYHTPNDTDKMNSHLIELPSNLYANLYDGEGNYLQVIRPNQESFNTNNLSKAKYTILAPHFAEEDDVDSHIAVFMEAMNQTEQRIDVLR